MDIISLFSGCGGLDLGFEKASFKVKWANEKDPTIWPTYEFNHKKTILDKRNVSKIKSTEIPDCIGIIGGPPCQSWSTGGKGLGKDDPRGKMFFEFIRILKDKKPLFFVAENVVGMFAERHKEAFEEIKVAFSDAGYNISIALLNASDYNVPQDRVRFFFVGYRKDLNLIFEFPRKSSKHSIVKDHIWDLRKNAVPSKQGNRTNGLACKVTNHEYFTGTYSYIYMSRNRVLSWDKPSYTIQASARHISIHPKAPKMVKVEKDIMKFNSNKLKSYRRLTVRECARLQTFPDSFEFKYEILGNGYKMIGNAVPVNLAYAIAKKIKSDLRKTLFKNSQKEFISKNGFTTTLQRSEIMKKITSKGTLPELILQNNITDLGLKPTYNDKSIIGCPDLVFQKEKVVVFVDGDFWHGYNWKEKSAKIKRNKNYWLQKIEKNINRDKRYNKKLKIQGYKVLRFWENDIKKDVKKCVNKILTHLNRIKQSSDN